MGCADNISARYFPLNILQSMTSIISSIPLFMLSLEAIAMPHLLTLIGLGFFDIFRFEGADAAPLIIFVVCGPIATKFCTGIDNQSISSNMEKIYIKLMTS